MSGPKVTEKEGRQAALLVRQALRKLAAEGSDEDVLQLALYALKGHRGLAAKAEPPARLADGSPIYILATAIREIR